MDFNFNGFGSGNNPEPEESQNTLNARLPVKFKTEEQKAMFLNKMETAKAERKESMGQILIQLISGLK